ncbi:CopD family protein [Mycolicibacterium palauense]|uniref:CopD family protein n=1 Tax=Mycolicibacterium palauense TaxID=2034511 RepID=UPI0011451FE6|nr:CopD family protein [Mycolicibacterium palauense]
MPESAPPTPALSEILLEVLYYLSLSVPAAIGITVAALAIPEARGGVVSRRVRALAAPAAVFVIAVAVLQFLSAVARFGHTGLVGAASMGVVSEFVASPPSRGSAGGATTLAQFGIFVLVAAGLVGMRSRDSRGLAIAVTAITVIGAMIPHIPTSFSPIDGLVRNVLIAAHILGMMFWVGGLIVLAAAGIIGRRTRGGLDTDARAAQDWIQIWERFTVVALYSVGALLVSGAWLSWTHVGTPSQLLTTAYGRYLAIKLVLVLALLVAGAYNTRVLIPRIRAAQHGGDAHTVFHLAVRHFPVVVVAESVVTVGILFVVPFLRGSARTEAGWPGAGPFDLTVFATGLGLVALTAVALWAGTRTAPRSRTP